MGIFMHKYTVFNGIVAKIATFGLYKPCERRERCGHLPLHPQNSLFLNEEILPEPILG